MSDGTLPLDAPAPKPAPKRRREPPPTDWRPIGGRLATDPDAPCATTASGTNNWPEIWAERLTAGERLLPECEGAARAWLERQRLPVPDIDEIW